MTGCSPLLWLVRAHGRGRGTRDRQLALIMADARTPGREGNTRQAARPSRGWFAHAGTCDRQLLPVVLDAHTPGRERDT